MSDHIFYFVLALLFVGLLLYLVRLQQQLRQARNVMQFFRQITALMGLLTVNYDISKDVVMLSPDCARLFHLPEVIEHFAQQGEKAKEDASNPLHPIALCLSSISGETSWQYLRHGEPVRHFQLRSYVLIGADVKPVYMEGVFRDVTKEVNASARLAIKAQFDGLTRIHNSGATRSWMQAHIGVPQADGSRGGMLFLLDVDHFKQVNDTIGHQGGDRALICVANALRHAFSGRGFLGWLGGDEFVAYLRETDMEKAEALAKAIHENALRLGHEAGLPLDLTVSIGCAILDGENYEAAYKKADRALYAAKEKGRNTHVILPAKDDGDAQAE